MFGISAFSQAPFSTVGGGAIKVSSGAVTANALASALPSRIRTFSGVINADGSVVVNGIRVQQSPASINANATLTADSIRTRTDSASVSGTASVITDGLSLAYATGSIFNSLEVTANNVRIRTNSAGINAEAFSTALGGQVFAGHASITADGTVITNPQAIWSANATPSSRATITASGIVLGEEWSDSDAGNETWAESSTGNELWVEDTPESNTWLRKG